MAEGYGPFNGITVLDLTQFLSGPMATMIMADLGADVIKIERPDRPKASGPFLNGERVYDLSIQRSKKSVTLNLKAEQDKQVFLRLVQKADVVVENFKPPDGGRNVQNFLPAGGICQLFGAAPPGVPWNFTAGGGKNGGLEKNLKERVDTGSKVW